MKYLAIALWVLHGSIHFIGLPPLWGKATGDSALIGPHWAWAWGLAALLLLSAGTGYALGWEKWWWAGCAGLLLSQFLIIWFWPIARWGTAVNLALFLSVLSAAAAGRFTERARAFEAALRARAVEEQPLTGKELPGVAARWQAFSNAAADAALYGFTAHQQGRMRTKPDGKWMPFRAEQFTAVRAPAFSWSVAVSAGPGIALLGHDTYAGGQGHMLISLGGLFPVVDESGPAIDQGALLRFLAELVWMPQGAVHPGIRWEAVGESQARAVMAYEGVEASGVFTFSSEGAFQRFEADRYYTQPGGAVLRPWLVEAAPQSYKAIGGAYLPTRLQITWKLEEGDFLWYEVELTAFEYDRI